MDNQSKKKLLYLLILVLLLILVWWVFAKSKDGGQNKENNNKAKTSPSTSQASATPTQSPSAGPITFEIISPEGDTFVPRQARMWSAKLSNFQDEYGVLATCHWKFYLNENNNETLYKEMDGRAVLSTEGENSCAFTSTFIETRGLLRAEVTITIPKGYNRDEQVFTAERKYTVQ